MTETMLNEDIRKQVVEVLADMEAPVEILFFGSETTHCDYCNETRKLLEEVAALSDMINVQMMDLEKDSEQAKRYNVDKVPGFVIASRRGNEILDYGVRYAGIPAGHEFTSLINDLLLVSKGDSNLQAETREFLRNIKEPVHLQVFVTPT